MLSAAQTAVRAILERWEEREWTVQGLGMLRTYLPGNARLHIWNPGLAVEGVSELHTRPWDLRSTVIAGAVTNALYRSVSERAVRTYVLPCWHQRLHCGEGGGLCGGPIRETLFEASSRTYYPGDTYEQPHDAIHRSAPTPYALTIIERQVPPGGSPDHADVFWPVGREWGSAEPRPAEPEEIEQPIERSLALMEA